MGKRHAKNGRSAVTRARRNDLAWLRVMGARQNNLKSIDVDLPLRRFVCVTGVSGSGKSSLVNDILREQLTHDLNFAEKVHPGEHDAILGKEHLDKVVDIDQAPIGRTPRSNPATYIKVFDQIRELYAKLPDSKVRGYKPGRFSFNVAGGAKGGGRCEACEGNGANKIEMDFLADVWVTCPLCRGRRFSRETLQVLFKGKTIADVLEMDVADALAHFSQIPKIASMLQTLHDVGLDYIKLGQSSTTLSGGEAQRIKLARELVKTSTGRTLYLLDEPTTGLHFDDIKRLLTVLHGFVDTGNTVVVIEHNLDVIKTADWVIDLGPEGGEEGGHIVAEGTPEDVAAVAESYTGRALREVLGIGTKVQRQGGTKSAHRARRPRSVPHPSPTAKNGAPAITVVGAKQHNLKDITVAIPRGKSTVFCGPSGSGKSSLALDTIYAEGQRRYVESLSAYARQFLGQIEKPRVNHVYGLSPAIAIEQKAASKSPRSTVGTVTEIYDYMRILWARVGRPHCPICHVPIGTQTRDEIVERIVELGEGTRALLLAPIERSGQESFEELFERERANGFTRVRIDGTVHSLDGTVSVSRRRRHDVELVVDRIVVKANGRLRLTDSVEQALTVGRGVLKLQVLDAMEGPPVECPPPLKRWGSRSEGEFVSPTAKAMEHPRTEHRFSQIHSCEKCGRSYDEPTPHHFSFNSRLGWCTSCEGLGVQRGASPAAIAVHPNRSILDGALVGWENARSNPAMVATLSAVAKHIGFDPQTAWCALSEAHQLGILQGCGSDWIDLTPVKSMGDPCVRGFASPTAEAMGHPSKGKVPWKGLRFRWKGFFPAIDRATRSSWKYRKHLEELVTDVPCEGCGGSRLRRESRCVEVGGERIEDICRRSLPEALRFFKTLKLDRREKRITGELLHEIMSRVQFLLDVGLDYMTLQRSAPTLSGGESQRIRLASQIGSGLTGVLYVLDEPTIGLHPRDNARLLAAFGRLRDLGNTLIIVEHDREVIDHADHVLDFGPGAGMDGGRVVAEASPKALRQKRASLTGRYLSGAENIPVPSNRRAVREGGTKRIPERWLIVEGAHHNNLKEIDVAFPLGRFIAVTGVSGSGKSSLVSDTLYNALAVRIHRARLLAGGHERIVGAEHIDKVINVDQSPIGNSPASNPATYTGLFDLVRELFAKLPDSKVRGFSANRFSFNRPGGRCDACAGLGQRCIEMHFLPDVWIECEHCGGTRYVQETLDVKYKGKHIADVLGMRVSEARAHFKSIPKLGRMLDMLDDVGLGYLQLGQSAPTLSGGEAQRVKLAAELGRPSTGKTLYILDEPTTGLHFDDLKKLLAVLHRLVDLGNTVVCIEHNLDVIKTADYIIDIGPEAGASGGTVVVAGDPERVAAHTKSHTGVALKPVLAAGPLVEREVFDADTQAAAERELEGRVAADTESAAEARMPWEIDGRRWHTVRRLDRSGKPVAWDPALLEWLVEAMEKTGKFAPTNWNERALVEIRAPGTQSSMWFAHFRTGGRELLDISVRTPARHFDNKTVVRSLNVKTLDERTDLPIYGREPRVRLRADGRQFDDTRICLRDFKDVNKKAFRGFLKKAADAYFLMVAEHKTDPVKSQPWKVDGRKWHLSQQSINAGHVIRWKPQLILELIGRMTQLDSDIEFDWTGKIGIGLKRKGESKVLGKVVTNMGAGVRVGLRTPKGRFTPVQIERLGALPQIRPQRDHDRIDFWIKSLKECDVEQLSAILASTRGHGRTSRPWHPEPNPGRAC